MCKKHEIENRPHLDNQRRCRKNFNGFELLGLKVKAKIWKNFFFVGVSGFRSTASWLSEYGQRVVEGSCLSASQGVDCMGPKMITFLHVDLEGAVCPDQGEEGGDDGQAPAGQHHHPHHRLFIAELLVKKGTVSRDFRTLFFLLKTYYRSPLWIG